MKIAIVVREYHRRGGVSKVMVEIAERMANLGHEVHVFTGNYDKIENTKVIFHKIPMIKGLVFDKLGLYKISKFFQGISFCIISKFYLKYDIFDIVHVNGDTLANFDIRMAHSCHKAWLKLANKNLKGPLDWIKKNLNPHHWRILITEKFNFTKGNYKKIIAVSQGVKREIMEFYKVPFDNIVVIPNGIDLKEFSPENVRSYKKEIRKKYGIYDNDFVLLFVGYEFRRKGLEYIIRALPFIEHEQIKLLIVGKDNFNLYRNIANKLGVMNKIIFVGQQLDVKKFYSASDVFVFPTLYEAFSLATLEAAASGLPILATKVNGTEELIEDGINGFFIQRDPVDIADKVNKLIKDKNLITQMQENIRKKAKEYSWDKITDRILNVYKEVLKTKK